MRGLLEKRHVFLALLALGVFTLSARSVTDPDFWWHLRTGQLILRNHAVFHTDPYSFTRFGQPWINHEWLSDVLIFSLYRLAGWGGLIIAFAAVITAIFVLAFLRYREDSSSALLITVWAAVASSPLWGARPQMFSLLLISIFLLILERSNRNPLLLCWLPPLMLLWVNLHAGFLAGIGLILIFAAGDGIDSMLGRAPWPQTVSRIKKLGLTLIVSLAVIPLNPYGWKMYWYPVATIHSKAMQSHIAEWFSPDFHQAQYLPVLLLLLACIVGIAFASRWLLSCDLILLLTTMYMGLHSQRHLAIFALVAAPILSKLFSGWLREHRRGPLVSRPERPAGQAKPLANLAIILAVVAFAGFRVRHVLSQQSAAEAARFPAAAVAYLVATHPPAPLFNYYDWGGYFIWKLPEYRVYIDGRADLYGDSFMDQFSADYTCRADCGQNSLNRWNIRTIILPAGAPLITALQVKGGWKEIYSDMQTGILTQAPERLQEK